MKAHVDDEVAQLLEKLCDARDEHLEKIGARRKRVQTDMNAAARLCSAHGAARLNYEPTTTDERAEQRRLRRLHVAAEKLLQRDVGDDDENVRTPSVVFTPTSAADLADTKLVGQLDRSNDADRAGETKWNYTHCAIKWN